jgi:hypothetical protein
MSNPSSTPRTRRGREATGRRAPVATPVLPPRSGDLRVKPARPSPRPPRSVPRRIFETRDPEGSGGAGAAHLALHEAARVVAAWTDARFRGRFGSSATSDGAGAQFRRTSSPCKRRVGRGAADATARAENGPHLPLRHRRRPTPPAPLGLPLVTEGEPRPVSTDDFANAHIRERL